MSQDHDPGESSAGSSSRRSRSNAPPRYGIPRPEYMTVGSGSTSASAAALMASLDNDSGYGGSIADDSISNGEGKSWHPGVTADRYTPAHTPTALGDNNSAVNESERRHLASHVHQLYYNQNRAALGRQITRTVEALKNLQKMNSTWPAQYPMVAEPPPALKVDSRPGYQTTQSSNTGGELHHQVDNIPLRPGAPRRAATSLGEGSAVAESSSDAPDARPKEPERLVTPQLAQEFSVLKLNMNVQGMTQTQISQSMKKETIASLLDEKIKGIIQHLFLLRDRIEDSSSKVLVTGDLNAGKSTFCNALLRRKVLPEDQQPCTSIFCEVLDAKENGNLEEAHGVHKETTYNRNDESTYDPYRLDELEKIVGDFDRYTQCKVYVKDIRTIDESLLNNGVVDISIIDAPGLNSDSLKTTAVFARQEEIDVVVFVVSAANHFTLSAKQFIWTAAHEKAYMFFVVNGFDNIRDKERCERMILEQIAGLSPRTFKESSELVHFVSSNAIPVAPASAPNGGDGGGEGGGGGGSGGYSNDFPKPDDDENETLGKHGEPGSPPKKDKGKDKEKIQDFEKLESSLRRFVLEKRNRSKLAPAKDFLLNLFMDLHQIATLNRDVAQTELDRAVYELDELEPAYESSKRARSQVGDDVDKTIEETCASIYNQTRTVLNNTITQVAEADLDVVYPGLFSAFQFGEDIKAAMLDQISAAVDNCEADAKLRTIDSINIIKNLGIMHVGTDFPDLTFNSDSMFTGRRDILAREVNFDVEFMDFFDFSSLWNNQDSKIAGSGMALTVAGVVGGRMMGGFGWVDGALGAVRVMGTQNLRRMIVPGIFAAVLLTTTYALTSIPTVLPRTLSRRIGIHLSNLDFIHQNATRIAQKPRKVLRYPADQLRTALADSERELGEKREGSLKVKRESEVARKYFGNLVRETGEGKRSVEGIDLEGPAPGLAGGYDEGELQ